MGDLCRVMPTVSVSVSLRIFVGETRVLGWFSDFAIPVPPSLDRNEYRQVHVVVSLYLRGGNACLRVYTEPALEIQEDSDSDGAWP